jgi:pyruvate-formate lyase
MLHETNLPDSSYLRDIAARLRSRAQDASPATLRQQLLELAEYYDGMANAPAVAAAEAPTRA